MDKDYFVAEIDKISPGLGDCIIKSEYESISDKIVDVSDKENLVDLFIENGLELWIPVEDD